MVDADKRLVKKYKNKMGMFDFIKGVAIFIVVLFHTVGSLNANPFVSSVSALVLVITPPWMSVFFLASGYWFSPKSVKEYTGKNLSHFVKQYIGVGVVTTLCYGVIHFFRFHWIKGALKGSSGVVFAYLLGNKKSVTIGEVPVYEIGPIWFLLALCFGGVVLNIVMNTHWIRNKRLGVLILAVLGLLLGHSVWIPYCASPVLGAALCLYVGYEIKQSKYLISIWRPGDYVRLVIASVVGMLVMSIGYRNLGYQEVTLEMISGLPIGLLLLRFGLLTEGVKNKIVDLFKHLGRYTLWILMVHTVEMLSIDWSALTHKSFFVNHPLISLLAVLAVRWGIIAVGCLIISKVGKIFARRKLNESAG